MHTSLIILCYMQFSSARHKKLHLTVVFCLLQWQHLWSYTCVEFSPKVRKKLFVYCVTVNAVQKLNFKACGILLTIVSLKGNYIFLFVSTHTVVV
jgi:hypothetical protein